MRYLIDFINIDILYLLDGYLLMGYRYTDIQTVAVVLSTHREKMKLYAYEELTIYREKKM